MSTETERRGLDRLLLRNFSIQDLKYASTTWKGKEYLIFKTNIKPSMKNSDIYVVELFFERSTNSGTYKFSPHPNSRCKCINGKVLCSHLVAFCLFFRFIQLSKSTLQGCKHVLSAIPNFIDDFMSIPIDIATIIDSYPSNKKTKCKETSHPPKKKSKYTNEYQVSDIEEIGLL